jgi:hypothetical protein
MQNFVETSQRTRRFGRNFSSGFEPLEARAMMAVLSDLVVDPQGLSFGQASDQLSVCFFLSQSPAVDNSESQPVTVSSVTPSRSGFTVQFSRPVDPNRVHLFDTTTNEFGISDVTLTGSTTGDVRGSVVFDATNTVLTFIKTGQSIPYDTAAAGKGTLAPDTYTLRLRSSETGFVDSEGNPLRDIERVNAVDFVRTFNIDAPENNEVTLSLPDFARGYGQEVNVPNTSTGLPVFISNANNISSVEFTIDYNPELLTITGATTQMEGASASINFSTPGTAVIQVSSADAFALVDGAATILNLIASVPATAPYASKGVIRFESLLVRDTSLAEVPSNADNAVHVAAFFGDLNADQGYDSADTILIQRLGMEANRGKTAYQTLDPYVIGDTGYDHSIDSADAIAVQGIGVGNVVPGVPNLPAGASTKVIYGADPQLSIGVVTASSAAPNTNVFVPINLMVTEASGITLAGMDIAVSFDPSRFQINAGGVSIASSTQNGLIWETDVNGVPNPNLVGSAFTLATNIDNLAGTIRIQLSSANGTTTLPLGTNGTLLQVRFTTKAGAAAGLSVINLLANEGATTTRLRDNNLVALTLLPVPTNGSNDLVDGSITIPVLTRANASVSGNVLTPITNTGTWADLESGPVTLSASIGAVTKNADGTWSWSYQAPEKLIGQTVTISATSGANVSTTTFSLNAFSTIATRGLVYVGATGASASTSLATDKSALLPGQSSTFANYTNYSRGLNGIVIDLNGLTASTTSSQVSDSLQFASWDGIAAAGFASLPGAVVPTVTILPGGGAGGSARIRITFPNNTVQNTWLRVTVLANANTGLAANDVFYFGNVIGELNVDNTATRLRVNLQDVTSMLTNQSPAPNSANASNQFDLDRNGRVNGQDYAILFANLQAGGIVAPITAPSSRPTESSASTWNDDVTDKAKKKDQIALKNVDALFASPLDSF